MHVTAGNYALEATAFALEQGLQFMYALQLICQIKLAVCSSLVVSALVSINEIGLHRTRLLLGWVIVSRQINHLGM